jgi:hypothetical protein
MRLADPTADHTLIPRGSVSVAFVATCMALETIVDPLEFLSHPEDDASFWHQSADLRPRYDLPAPPPVAEGGDLSEDEVESELEAANPPAVSSSAAEAPAAPANAPRRVV